MAASLKEKKIHLQACKERITPAILLLRTFEYVRNSYKQQQKAAAIKCSGIQPTLNSVMQLKQVQEKKFKTHVQMAAISTATVSYF